METGRRHHRMIMNGAQSNHPQPPQQPVGTGKAERQLVARMVAMG